MRVWTAVASTAIVPLAVMVPPVSPAPALRLVTVPALVEEQVQAEPFHFSTSPFPHASALPLGVAAHLSWPSWPTPVTNGVAPPQLRSGRLPMPFQSTTSAENADGTEVSAMRGAISASAAYWTDMKRASWNSPTPSGVPAAPMTAEK